VEQTLSGSGGTEHAIKDEEAAEHAEEANPEEKLGEVGNISHGEIRLDRKRNFFCETKYWIEKESLFVRQATGTKFTSQRFKGISQNGNCRIR
jgi:hypothetical protein